MRRYRPGKGLDAPRRALGQSRSTKVRPGTPPRGKEIRVGFDPGTQELVVTARGKTLRRKVYGEGE